MTATEKLYQIIQTLPEAQISEVLNFAEFLQHRQASDQDAPKQPNSIPPGTLTDKDIAKRRADAIKNMKGLLKADQPTPTDEEVTVMLETRRTEKYL